jgi:hypothetical protein
MGNPYYHPHSIYGSPTTGFLFSYKRTITSDALGAFVLSRYNPDANQIVSLFRE